MRIFRYSMGGKDFGLLQPSRNPIFYLSLKNLFAKTETAFMIFYPHRKVLRC